MEFIKQVKGTALEKISKKALVDDDGYYESIKYDGQCIQIAYDGDVTVKFWSSNGHPFYCSNIAVDIMSNNTIPFHVEAEYTGTSKGNMGDRGESSKITTYRTEFAKDIFSMGTEGESFRVFDILSFDGEDVRQDDFEARTAMMMQLNYSDIMKSVEQTSGRTLADGRASLAKALEKGLEGVILTHKTHVIKSSGRSPLRAKLKDLPTGYATVIDIIPGKDARLGTVGALLLRDEDGLEFSSGGGLNSDEWGLPKEVFIGKKVKFRYESVKDGNYIQPSYMGVCLEDKSLVRFNEL